MYLPNPSLHGRGIQPWRSPSPPGRSSPILRRWSPFPGCLSLVPNQNTIARVRGINMLRLLCSNPEPRNFGFQTPAAVLLPRPRDRLLMVNDHGSQGFPGSVFFRAGKNLSRSVAVVSTGARFHRISGWVGNPVLLFEVAWSRMAEKMKASEWMVGSKQMVNLRAIGGKTAPTVGFWITGRVPGWLLLKVPPWKDRLLQESRMQRLATGLTWLPVKTKTARVMQTKHARVWDWARVLGPGPKPGLQECQFRAGPATPVQIPDKRICKSARVGNGLGSSGLSSFSSP